MRKIFAPLALFVAVVGAAPTSFAQSAYDYPWCAVYDSRSGGGARSCYYATYQQCMATISGIGGYCIRSPYYRGPYAAGERGGDRRYQRYERY
jgi:Protein of unknown function (DUF3551)